MGFVLSVLYFVTNYLTPPVIFGVLANARVELILAVVILFVSLPKLTGSIILKTPQSVALIGLAFAGSLSVLFTQRWIMGAIQAFPAFIPLAFAYFLVCLHCNSKKKLQIIIFMQLFVCLFVIAYGSMQLRQAASDSTALNPGSMQYPYILAMKDDAGESFYRLRGLGLINDPNDFAQLIVCEIPLLFFFWRSGNLLRNIFCVILPGCALLYGMFLTHSRGALVALLAVTIMAARRRIGTLPAVLIAGCVFAAAMALHFTGGREISTESGSDRTELWSESLQLLKSHPLFGVGPGALPDYLGHTAHNSVAVCAAELGLVGLYFWCLFLFPSLRDTITIASPAKVSEAIEIEPEAGLASLTATKIEVVDKAEINRLGRLLILSFTGFLVAGWFLSRAYVLTFFLLGGIAEVIYEMALRRGMVAPRLPFARVAKYSGVLAILLILLLYVMLRTVNLMH
jgi:O-antigen ligase